MLGLVAAGRAQASAYPSHVDATLSGVLAQAHKTWRRDAVVTSISLQWYPPNSASAVYWLAFRLYSPSNGDIRDLVVGGPNDGNFNDIPAPRDPQQRIFRVVGDPIPAFRVDLPAAIATIRSRGLSAPLEAVELRMVGATGTPPLAAWTIRTTIGSGVFFPLAIDAQTGQFIPWRRAFDPPGASDQQLSAMWNYLLHRNQRQNPGEDPGKRAAECVALIQDGFNCAM